MLPLRRLRELIPALAGKRVVVVGDIIADEYLYGKPARIALNGSDVFQIVRNARSIT